MAPFRGKDGVEATSFTPHLESHTWKVPLASFATGRSLESGVWSLDVKKREGLLLYCVITKY